MNEGFRQLPQVDRLIDALGPEGAGAGGEPHALKAAAARRVIDEARGAIAAGAPAPTTEQLAASASRLLEAGRRRRVGLHQRPDMELRAIVEVPELIGIIGEAGVNHGVDEEPPRGEP